MFTLQNNKWAKSGNGSDRHEGNVIGIDMGGKASNFAVCVSSYGEIDRFGSAELEELCQKALTDESVRKGMYSYFFYHTEKMMLKWKRDGVTDVFVGCCRGNYLQLVNWDENNILIKSAAYFLFTTALRELGKETGIRVDAKADESYTSVACSLTSDYMPIFDEKVTTIKWGGDRHGGLYITKTHLVLDADVNGAANIIRKNGFDLNLPLECDFRREIRSMV